MQYLRKKIKRPYDSPKFVSDLFSKDHVIGGGFREKERCPVCNSIDRLRFTIEVLKRYTDIFTSECKVLEFAPIEASKRALSKNPKCSYTTGDIVPGRADKVLDITHIDYPDNSFDFVLCNHVLEHIEDESAAVKELIRITKDGGTIELSMPIDIDREETIEETDSDRTSYKDEGEKKKARLERFGQDDHVRLYGKDAAYRLRKYGIDVKEITADETWKAEISKYRLIPGDLNFLCKVTK